MRFEISGRILLLLFVTVLARGARADQCQVLDQTEAEKALNLLEPGTTVLEFCKPCGDAEPMPVEVRHVEAVAWSGGSPSGRLSVVRMNGEEIDAAYRYFPVGEHRWRNLAMAIDCDVTDVPEVLDYRLPRRDAALEVPPASVLEVEITHRAYDGGRFADRWTAAKEVELRAEPTAASVVVARVATGETVEVVEVWSRVQPARVEVVYDHRHFQAGDVLYLLDSLGEGFMRMWHYGRVREEDDSGIDVYRLRVDNQGCRPPSPECWGEAAGLPRETWWGQVRTAAGAEGWVAEPWEHFRDVMLGH